VQFWDATTGDHLVTLQLPGDNSEWAYSLDWSPNSNEVAVGTNKRLLIVDGLTGKIISSHAANVPTAISATSASGTYFAKLIPASGGYGYRAATWSPDGKLLASALSLGVNGELEVWNPQTGAIVFTITLSNSYNIGALAWSSDGQYIAATTWNTQSLDPTQPNSRVVVWSVATHQVVFQHDDYMDSNAPVAWQPQSHNLAFGGATRSGGNPVESLEIWNTTTGKLVKQYVGAGTGRLAWSPDGTYLAYADSGVNGAPNPVTILDASTGKQIFVYNGHLQQVSVIAWSPDGRYIASGEGNSQGKAVAKVWVA
jgi:WD40 repeat protein